MDPDAYISYFLIVQDLFAKAAVDEQMTSFREKAKIPQRMRAGQVGLAFDGLEMIKFCHYKGGLP